MYQKVGQTDIVIDKLSTFIGWEIEEVAWVQEKATEIAGILSFKRDL